MNKAYGILCRRWENGLYYHEEAERGKGEKLKKVQAQKPRQSGDGFARPDRANSKQRLDDGLKPLVGINTKLGGIILREYFTLADWEVSENAVTKDAGNFDFQRKKIETSEDLALIVGLAPSEVSKRWEKLWAMAKNLEIECVELAELIKALPPRSWRGGVGGLILLDVRRPDEFERGHLAGSHLVSGVDLQEVVASIRREQEQCRETGLTPTRVVTICHHGVRSLSAAMYLREEGLHNVQSLAGGVDAWSQQVDATFPRY